MERCIFYNPVYLKIGEKCIEDESDFFYYPMAGEQKISSENVFLHNKSVKRDSWKKYVSKWYFSKRLKRVLIVTGRNSAHKSGALEAVLNKIKQGNVEYIIYDRISENPSIESIIECRDETLSFKPELIIGIGGGSPLDAAKGIAVALSNDCTADDINSKVFTNHLPVIAVPTTSGTGSEVTPFAIFTYKGIKKSMPSKVYPVKAFVDPDFISSLSKKVFIETFIDALSHLIEGYCSGKGSYITDAIAEKGLNAAGELFEKLKNGNFSLKDDSELRFKACSLSAAGGLVISQAYTSIPHILGYPLTVSDNISHGAVCGMFLYDFLACYPDLKRSWKILDSLNCSSFKEFGEFIDTLFGLYNFVKPELSDEEIDRYTLQSYEIIINSGRYPYEITAYDVRKMYLKYKKHL